MDSRAAVEDWVVSICQQLGLPIHSTDDDFFEAGATSLTVMRLIERVEKEYGENALSPEEVVEHSAIRAIAAAITENGCDAASATAD